MAPVPEPLLGSPGVPQKKTLFARRENPAGILLGTENKARRPTRVDKQQYAEVTVAVYKEMLNQNMLMKEKIAAFEAERDKWFNLKSFAKKKEESAAAAAPDKPKPEERYSTNTVGTQTEPGNETAHVRRRGEAAADMRRSRSPASKRPATTRESGAGDDGLAPTDICTPATELLNRMRKERERQARENPEALVAIADFPVAPIVPANTAVGRGSSAKRRDDKKAQLTLVDEQSCESSERRSSAAKGGDEAANLQDSDAVVKQNKRSKSQPNKVDKMKDKGKEDSPQDKPKSTSMGPKPTEQSSQSSKSQSSKSSKGEEGKGGRRHNQELRDQQGKSERRESKGNAKGKGKGKFSKGDSKGDHHGGKGDQVPTPPAPPGKHVTPYDDSRTRPETPSDSSTTSNNCEHCYRPLDGDLLGDRHLCRVKVSYRCSGCAQHWTTFRGRYDPDSRAILAQYCTSQQCNERQADVDAWAPLPKGIARQFDEYISETNDKYNDYAEGYNPGQFNPQASSLGQNRRSSRVPIAPPQGNWGQSSTQMQPYTQPPAGQWNMPAGGKGQQAIAYNANPSYDDWQGNDQAMGHHQDYEHLQQPARRQLVGLDLTLIGGADNNDLDGDTLSQVSYADTSVSVGTLRQQYSIPHLVGPVQNLVPSHSDNSSMASTDSSWTRQGYDRVAAVTALQGSWRDQCGTVASINGMTLQLKDHEEIVFTMQPPTPSVDLADISSHISLDLYGERWDGVVNSRGQIVWGTGDTWYLESPKTHSAASYEVT